MPRSASPSRGIAGLTLVLLLAGVALAVTAVGVATYRAYEREVRAGLGNELTAIAELKVGELAQWRTEREADARFFGENRAFALLTARFFATGDEAAAAEIRQWFTRMRAGDRYEGISLLDAGGVARLVDPDAPALLGTSRTTHPDIAHESHASGQVMWVDFHRDSPDDAIHLSLISPITNDDGTPLGAVLLRIDPTVYLYPFIQRWPVPVRTAETFIVRREGDEVVYLTPLRFDAGGALRRRMPLNRTDVPGVRGGLGEEGVFEGVDYADRPVVAAVRQVPGAPWVLVARMDPAEAWAPVRDRLRQTIAIGLLFIIAVGGGLAAARQRSIARADAALRDSERRYRQLFHANPHPMWVYDTDTLRFLAVNDAAILHYGWTEAQFLQMTIADIRPDEDVARLREDVAHLPSIGADTPSVWRHFKADGTLIDVEIMAHSLEFEGRKASLVLAHDITARVGAEREIRDLNDELRAQHAAGATALARLRALIEASPTVLYTLAINDPAYQATWVSDNVLRILGYTVDEALAPGWWGAHLHPEDRDRAYAEHATLTGRGQLVHEYRFADRHGRYRIIRDESRLATGADGTPTEAVGAWTDLTAQREAEDQQRLHLSVLEAAANAIVVTSAQGRIEWANPAFTALTGYTLDEARGHTPGELLKSGRHDEAFYREMWATVKGGGIWQGELVNRRKDGTLYDEEMTITPVRDARGAIAHFVAIKQNVSERKHLQAELLQAQRMETVGRLAGGVAHDFNNLLTVINSYSELAIGDLDDGHPLRDSLVEIHKAGERAAGLTRQLLAFSRKQVLQPQELDLNGIVANLEKMLRRLIGEDVAFVVQPDPAPCLVRADPGQIEQVLMNLSVNARDAMPTGGTLTIETRHLLVDAHLSEEHPGLMPGEWIAMVVSDTGHGMDEEVSRRAFEPFFTTKGVGHGTGLGLPTVFGIVQQSGGVVWVDSAPGEGARFTICLPALKEARAVSGGSASPPARGSEVVLIVEDDDMLRELTKHVLASAGYDAHTAANGDNALLLLHQRERPVDLLLTDVVMPGITGRELAERIRARWPATKVLFMSGYMDDTTMRHGVLDGRARLVHKPFNRAQILKAVRDALDGN
ncbi:MAG: PAS domain S-box protein [Vicinamibacterales bacterium]|nr:PAS domain S-box protein [Vicinamibacterales bacterium]